MIISLVERALVDAQRDGAMFRMTEDIAQLGLTPEECTQSQPPEGFVDHGVVFWSGVEYYMSSLTRPVKAEDACA